MIDFSDISDYATISIPGMRKIVDDLSSEIDRCTNLETLRKMSFKAAKMAEDFSYERDYAHDISRVVGVVSQRAIDRRIKLLMFERETQEG